MNSKIKMVLCLPIAFSCLGYAEELKLTNDEIADVSNKILSRKDEIGKHIQVKYFTPENDSDETASGWGVEYDWETSKKIADVSVDQGKFTFLEARGYTKGSYVFSDKESENNLAKTGFSIDAKIARFSAIERKLTKAENTQHKACTEKAEENGDLTLEEIDECDSLFPSVFKEEDENDSSYVWTTNAHLDVEANQGYTERQYLYGFLGSLKYYPASSDWRNVYNPFDLPFRITRALTGHPLGFNAERNAIPTIVLALDQVDPTKNEQREAILGNTDTFDRVYGELAFKTPMAMLNDRQVMFNYSYRYYREVKPDSAIRNANLHRFKYTTLAIQLPASAFNLGQGSDIIFSYSTGRLPFDLQSEAVFELGWKTNLDQFLK